MAFEVFEHTADIGVRVTAPDLERLFAEAGRALMALIVDNADRVEPRQTIAIQVEAESVEGLFVDWLSELIYRFEVERLLFSEFSVTVSGGHRLRAECRGERVDWSRHELHHELKAVTYHQLRVVQTDAGWEASVIFDI